MSEAVQNTDRELYREDTGDPAGSYYENSVHVTESGAIGMNVGGSVIVLPIAEWHSIVAERLRPTAALDPHAASSDRASYGAPMHMPMGTTCAVHAHREWVPIEQHHIWPKGMGGPDVAANKVAVCANGHYSIHEVIRRLIANNGVLPDSQHFSAKVRALGMRGWTEAGKPTHGGGGE